MTRADLHLHTSFSGSGHLRMRRHRRGLPRPEAVYETARAQGMDWVTFTDLDTIEGCLAFLDRRPQARDFFVSVELRVREPHTRAEVSVFVYDVTETHHRHLRRLQGDVRDVAAYVRGAALPASLGSVLGVLEAGGSTALVRELLGLFECFEMRNGSEGRASNALMARLVQEASAGRQFGVTAGSNAHSLGRVGRTFTVARAATLSGYLEELRRRRTWAFGTEGGLLTSFAEILRGAPLRPSSAGSLLDHALARARRSVRARRTRRRLDVIDMQNFQRKARSFHRGREASPEAEEAR